MTNYNNEELDMRIQAFMSKKMQKFPELNVKHPSNKTVSMPKISLRRFSTTRTI